ncbi:hypothetical protein ACFVWY_10475 [Streptomyces sp. NPDC058195]|uniref:hypothetical protein n=1 Tax=Streptomyces sp. NPDC058195 TaxID=3346375 RepID=UPI0036E79FAB
MDPVPPLASGVPALIAGAPVPRARVRVASGAPGDPPTEGWAPEASAALRRAAAGIPGATVARAAQDTTGCEGVAVARAAYGQRTQ